MSSTSLVIDKDVSARRYRYFPGWTMVAIAAMAQYMSAPGQSYSVAAFKEPMRESLAISETSFSLAYAFATIISGALLPVIGRMVDRHGARRILPGIALLLGAACMAMSQVSGLASLYLGFSVVRSLGQGALTLIAAWMVSEWFARRRGFATALSGMGGSLSVMTIPLLNVYVIYTYGWQTGWIVLALAVWLLFLPSLHLVRDRPEDLGLHPDGDRPAKSHDMQESPVESCAVRQHSSWEISQVIRDPTFWKMLAVPAASGMVGTGLIFHAVSLLGSRGVSAGWAMGLISLQATVATCAVLFAGWLTDRYPARLLLAAAMLLLAASSMTVLLMPVPVLAILYAAMLGVHGSILRSTGTVVWINYYGRANQGEIRGIAMAVMIFAAAAGPLPLALSIDWFGSYDLALYGFIAIPMAAAILVFTAKPPRTAPTNALTRPT
jgi:MFS family permease